MPSMKIFSGTILTVILTQKAFKFVRTFPGTHDDNLIKVPTIMEGLNVCTRAGVSDGNPIPLLESDQGTSLSWFSE